MATEAERARLRFAVDKLYEKYLGRAPDQAGIDYWMREGEYANLPPLTPQEIEWNIANSKEAQDYAASQTVAETTQPTEKLYDYTNQRETGDASNLYWGNFSKQLTESQLRSEFNASDNGQLRAAFGSFDNYLAYMNERQDLIDAGQLKADWWDTGVALIDPTTLGREAGMDDRALENTIIQAGAAEGEKGYSAQAGQMYALYQKYTGNSGPWYNKDGDKFEWNGSSFVKTAKVDDHNWGPAIRGLALAGVTIGAANQLVGLINGLSATQSQIAINALSSAVTSGGDPKAIVGSVLGQLGGDFLANSLVTYSGPGSQLLTAGVANGVADAIQQGITNGDIDLNSVIEAGLFGAGTEAAGQLIESIINAEGSGFDLDGLIKEDSGLFKAINGEFVDGKWVGGVLGDVRGAIDEFTTKYITGGEWWEAEGGNYKSIVETSPGQYEVELWNGTRKSMSMVDLIKQGFETGFFGGFEPTLGESAIFDFFRSNLDKIPDDWYDTLGDWLNNTAKSSGGSFQTESGTTVNVITTGDTSTDGGGAATADFNCADVNRQQVAGATKEEDCGGCLDGYQSDEFGVCVAVITDVCPAGQAWNDVAGMCVDEIFYTPGSPCNMEDGEQGVFDANGDCVRRYYGPEGPGDGTGSGTGGSGGEAGDACTTDDNKEGTLQDDGQGNLTCVPNTTGTGTGDTGGTGDTRKAGDACKTDDNKDGTLQENEEGILVCVAKTTTTGDGAGETTTVKQTCSDPDRATNKDGSCGELCADGTIPDQHEEGICGNPLITTVGPDGETTTEKCDNGATIESKCNECPDGSFPEEHVNNNCTEALITVGPSGGGGTQDDTCKNGATNYPDCNQCPQGEELGTDEEGQISCVPITRSETTDTGCTNGAIDSTCSECADGSKVDPNNPDEKCPTTVVTTPPPSGGGDDGGSMFGSSGLGSFSPAGQPGMFDPTVTAAVSLEQPLSFPIRDFLLEALPPNQRGMITGFKV